MSACTHIQRFAGWLAQDLRRNPRMRGTFGGGCEIKILCMRKFSSLICAKPLYMVKERDHKIVKVALDKGGL